MTRNREKWEESIPDVAALLSNESVKIQAKALWLIWEMGLAYPASVHDYVPLIVPFLDSEMPQLRERAVNALGRLGRGSYQLIESYWADLFRFANDEDAKVRLMGRRLTSFFYAKPITCVMRTHKTKLA